MATMENAVSHMRDNCEFDDMGGKVWSDREFAAYTAKTGLRVPPDLETFLRRHGGCACDTFPSFLASFRDGSRSVHETQIIVSDLEGFLGNHATFVTGDTWPDQFTLPMVFFGTADGGNSHLLMNGRDHGDRAVYLWERATDPFGTGNNARGLGRVADSLWDFMASLCDEADL